MIVLFGVSDRTKLYGEVEKAACARCHNEVVRGIIKETSCFTLFFLPIVPLRTQYRLICPICGDAQGLSREDFTAMVEGRTPAALGVNPISNVSDPYAGKTPTQVAYLKQMEEQRRAKELRT